MKAKLSLAIEKDLISKAKVYAAENNTSVSKLVEDHFKSIVNSKRPNFLDLIESLPKPDIDDGLDLKKAYYEERASKYGF
jgi:hypothetical protein